MNKIQEYERNLNKPKKKDVMLIRHVGVLLMLITAIVAVMMVMFADSTSMDFGRYLVDGITWFIMSLFFFMLFSRFKNRTINMDLKLVSLLAFIATLAKFISSIYYTIDRFGGNLWIDFYYVTKLLVWLALALFFFKYWRRMHDLDFGGEIYDDDDEE